MQSVRSDLKQLAKKLDKLDSHVAHSKTEYSEIGRALDEQRNDHLRRFDNIGR